MRVLISPLNWGLGHATRCIPIINDLLREGHEVVLGGAGESLELLRREFPGLWCRYIPSFHIRYSRGSSQVWAMLRCLPSIIVGSFKEHREIKRIVRELEIDKVISDNRFGLYGSGVTSTYMTHQIMVKMPRGLRWMEPLVYRLHRHIIERFDECWVPDYAEMKKSLAGDLTHKYPLPRNARFIGPLSRFTALKQFVKPKQCDVLGILSGVEPQKSMFEKSILERYPDAVIASHLTAAELLPYIIGAKKIVARCGYTTVMDMHLLGITNVEWSATPGQTEQEYLFQVVGSR